jgi:hypothetical protein
VQQAGKETNMSDKISHVSKAIERVTGFIDCLGGIGQGPFEEEGLQVLGEEELDEPFCVEFIAAEDLNEDAAFLRLHPRVRQKLLQSVDFVDVELQEKTQGQKKADAKVDKQRKKDLRKAGLIQEYHDMVEKEGVAAAVKKFTPTIVKKAGQKQKGKRVGKPVVMKLRLFSKTSGAAKRRAAKTKAFDNQQLAAQMAKAYVEARALRDAYSMEKQNATEARANPDLADPARVAERKEFRKAEEVAYLRHINMSGLCNRITEQHMQMEHVSAQSKKAQSLFQRRSVNLLHKFKELKSMAEEVAEKIATIPATKLQPDTIEQPALAPVPASQGLGAAAQGAASQASSPAAPPSGPTTQCAAAAAQPPGAAEQASSPGAHNPQVSRDPGPKRIDYNECDNATLWKCLGTINGQVEPDAIEYVKESTTLDQQTVHAGMEELHERLCGHLPVMMLPPAVCTAYAKSKLEDADFISQRDSSVFILGVIWASRPEHFTLIRAEREHIGLPWKTEFWDPLGSVKTSRSAGLAVLRNLALLPARETLPSSLPGTQTDGWSCGLHVLAKMEAWIRERRGEQPGLAVPIKEVLARLNEFLGKLRAATKPGAQSSGPAAGSPGPATEGSGAAAAASGPAAQGSCAAAQGSDPATGSSGPAAGSSGRATKGSGAAAAASDPAKAAPVQHATFEIALEAGQNCKKCVVTKKGTKGCAKCMGPFWFDQIRTRYHTQEQQVMMEMSKRWAEDDQAP